VQVQNFSCGATGLLGVARAPHDRVLPNRIGIHGALWPNVKRGIADAEMTLAQLVRQKGYATGMAGKWHLGSEKQFLPLQHGFEEYFGLPYSNDMWPLHPELRMTSRPCPLIEATRS